MFKKIFKKIPGMIKLARALGLSSNYTNKRKFLLDILPKNSVGAEIGVHMGDFSRQILDVVSPKELHLIDPWKHEESSTYKNALYGGLAKNGQAEMDERFLKVISRFDKEIREGLVKINRGYSVDVLSRFSDEYFDWIYIDGNHLYEYVKNDLELSFLKTRSKGYITGDDYVEGGWWNGGVKKAVDEFVKTQLAELIEIRDGQYILRKKS